MAGCWAVRARANPLSLGVWPFTLRFVLPRSWVGYPGRRPQGCGMQSPSGPKVYPKSFPSSSSSSSSSPFQRHFRGVGQPLRALPPCGHRGLPPGSPPQAGRLSSPPTALQDGGGSRGNCEYQPTVDRWGLGYPDSVSLFRPRRDSIKTSKNTTDTRVTV